MLTLHSVTAGYGGVTVLRDIDFTVGDGDVVALLGPNGAGKSTLLRTLTGFVKPTAGSVTFDGREVTANPPHQFARNGICLLPEGRAIFPSLTVMENLRIMAGTKSIAEAIPEALAHFPALRNRMRQTAGSLSGGEQQMLALSRPFMTNPKVVLVDEASLGLAPLIVDGIFDTLALLPERGVSVVLVEQYVQRVLKLAKTAYVLSRGEIVHVGDAKEMDPAEIYQKYLGVE
jgi:branched-chain amino acid transport system ATP-binding protein